MFIRAVNVKYMAMYITICFRCFRDMQVYWSSTKVRQEFVDGKLLDAALLAFATSVLRCRHSYYT